MGMRRCQGVSGVMQLRTGVIIGALTASCLTWVDKHLTLTPTLVFIIERE